MLSQACLEADPPAFRCMGWKCICPGTTSENTQASQRCTGCAASGGAGAGALAAVVPEEGRARRCGRRCGQRSTSGPPPPIWLPSALCGPGVAAFVRALNQAGCSACPIISHAPHPCKSNVFFQPLGTTFQYFPSVSVRISLGPRLVYTARPQEHNPGKHVTTGLTKEYSYDTRVQALYESQPLQKPGPPRSKAPGAEPQAPCMLSSSSWRSC